MKTSLYSVLLVSWLLPFTVKAQISFGVTNLTILGRPAISTVGFPSGLSASLQKSGDGVNFSGITNGWVATVISGQPTFVKTNLLEVGYYRVVTETNSVPYNSTNKLVHFRVGAGMVGNNRTVSVAGPVNLAYTLEGSDNLVVWTAVTNGVVGQTNFSNLANGTRFYRGKTQ